MSREMTWMGFLATMLIAVVMGINLIRESDRQSEAEIDLRIEAVTAGIDLYGENCAVCHGAAGEGLGSTPPLASEAVRGMDYLDVFRTIERGRYNTVMAAYGVNEGGVFANGEIDNLVAVIQYANWGAVATRVDELGLTPPEVVVVELTDETLDSVRSLPDGDALASGLEVYVTECAACHGANAEGTTLAPALNDADLRALNTDDALTRTIANGVPSTLMAGWDGALTREEIANLTLLIRRWEELDAAGVEMPVIETVPIDMSPEAIAQGEWLFSVTCTQCHGSAGYGTPLAPALNSQQFLSNTPDAAMQQIISLGVPGTVMPAWGGRFSEQDIASLVAYLRSLEATAPAIVETQTGAAGSGTTQGQGPPWQRNN
ncbi:MAG: c-type cytochrome [Anaerolineae bacterium]|nr:c-type cytochrome [Anaerolineae bacterium]